VQDWEAGGTLPSAERLEALLRALLEVGGLTPGREMAEAFDLWTAVERESPRMHTPFDQTWFASLLSALAPPAVARPSKPVGWRPADQPVALTLDRAQDWGDALDTAHFVGRADELALVQRWVIDEQCRLIAILGIGGIGKTSLAASLAQMVAPDFARVYWRSLRNAPPVTDWLAGAIAFLSDQHLLALRSESEQINSLLQLLRTRRCLLVLDNSETLFEVSQPEVRYRAGMEGYGRLLQALADARHRSCLVLTSREAPPELAALGRAARALELHGLGVAEAQALVADKHMRGDAQAWQSLVEHYGGNGLALKIVGETIRQVYDGDIAAFLSDASATYGTVFGGIRRLLDVQLERLSPVERLVLRRLAVEREPISLGELSTDLAPSTDRSTVIDGIETLRRRSLVERAEGGRTFTLQSMVLEYATDRLVETVANEIDRDEPSVLVEQPLIKAQAKDYVRKTQERLIGAPILQRLIAQDGRTGAEQHLVALLDGWRDHPRTGQGFGPGNAVNLLRLLRGELRGLDLSRLSLRQVYLQGVNAQDAKLTHANLASPVLAEAFVYPTTVALSLDGAFMAAAFPTGEVRLWRVSDRTLVLSLPAHAGEVQCVALSADGGLLASSGRDGMARLWDAATGQLLATFEGHSGPVWGVAIARDARFLASSSFDGTVCLWETRSGRLLTTMRGHNGPVWGVAMSADARLIASGGDDGSVRLWQAASGQLVATLEGHTGGVRGVALSGDGHIAASGSWDTTVRLWDTQRETLLVTLEGHTGLVMRVALSESGALAASAGYDGTVRLWETKGGQLVATLQGHSGLANGVAISGDEQSVATSGWDGTVRLWETDSRQLVAEMGGHADLIRSIAISSDGQLIASAGSDGTVRLWEAASGKLLSILESGEGLVYAVALTGDGRLLASAGWDGTIRLWDPKRAQILATFQGHTGVVWGVALSGDGRLLASGGVDGTVRLWDAASALLLRTLDSHTGVIYGVALSQDGRLVASAGVDGTVRVWETGTGRLVSSLQSHTGAVFYCVALSTDGRLVASGCVDATVRLWDSSSGQLLATLQGHTQVVTGVALSADGRTVASGGQDGTVRLWAVSTGQLLSTLREHTGQVFGVGLSEDGRLLASGGADGMLRVWETATGACLHALRSDRLYERLDVTGTTGITNAQRAALVALGAVDHGA
jgi:WD40 repeat protein